MKIGRILLSANLISQECLNEGLSIAKDLRQPIGKVLTNTQQVSDQDLQSALLAQSMMRQGLVEEDVAIETLKLAVKENVPFGQALAVISAPNKSALATDLEDLLLQSGMVSTLVLEEAKKKSLETNMPLGSSLIALRAIVFANLNYAFECITMIEQGRLTKQAAIKAMSETKKENISLNTALRKQQIAIKKTRWTLKLGDLLTAGKVITEKDSLNAIEQALTEKRLVGEILVKSSLVSPEVLRNALELQSFVTKGVISKDEAAVVLRQVAAENKTVDQVLRERKSLKDDPETAEQALELLITARLVEQDVVSKAMAKQERYQMDALKALVASDVINAEVCRAAIECAHRLAANAMTPQHAVLVLDNCDRLRLDFEQALAELSLAPASTEKKQSSKWSGTYEAHSKGKAPGEVPSWSSSIELKLALVAILLGVVGGVLVMILDPNYLTGYCICGVVLIVGIAFFTLGRIWEMRVKATKHELKRQEEAASQQVNRLAKSRSKENS